MFQRIQQSVWATKRVCVFVVNVLSFRGKQVPYTRAFWQSQFSNPRAKAAFNGLNRPREEIAEYLLIAQDRASVEHFTRQKDKRAKGFSRSPKEALAAQKPNRGRKP